ncbi:MAG: hypothetical protein OER21_14335 [Gemmatimonadota bacterium]|nr:hypothetical protein [Gemmatimonadota bacterium]
MRTSLIAGVALIGWLGSPLPRVASAQDVFQDPRGRFSIDLPPGFTLSSEQLDRIYVFQIPDARLFVSVAPGTRDLDRLWRLALDDFTGAGVPPPPAEAVTDLEVNGNPARMAWYGFDIGDGRAKVSYTVLLGAVVLQDGGMGVVCFSMLNDRAADQWGDRLRQAFRTIRVAGAPVISAI